MRIHFLSKPELAAALAGFVVLPAVAALSMVAPAMFWWALCVAVVAALLLLAVRLTEAFCAVWLVVTGLSLEMTLSDLVGLDAFQPTIAVIKAGLIVLSLVAALRWGARADLANPAWAIGAVALLGWAHGLHPRLSMADSLRSVAGSVAPFAFCFVRLPSGVGATMIRAVAVTPLIAVGGGVLLAAMGWRPLFVESGGMRLAGLGHPAFLAGICLAGVYASLMRLFRHGRAGDVALLGVNGGLLLLTGARAPLAYGVAVTVLAMLLVRSVAFPARSRLLLAIAAGLALPPVLLAADGLADIRILHLLNDDVSNLSGRDQLWPVFEAATAGSPWFGWGIGAGNVVLPPDSRVATMLQTWAAHNEYLRLRVEGGYVGLALILGFFVAWSWRCTARMAASDAVVIRLVFIALACHAVTDNVLISTPACVLITLIAAVAASGAPALPDSAPMA